MPNQEQINYAAKRNHICEYRFHDLIDSRIKSFYQQPAPSAQDARFNVLMATENYLTCLRNEYEQFPESVEPMYMCFYPGPKNSEQWLTPSCARLTNLRTIRTRSCTLCKEPTPPDFSIKS